MDVLDETMTELAGVRWSARGSRVAESPISAMMTQALAETDLVSLAAGFVDADTLPVKAVRRVVRELLADERAARAALQYGTTKGLLGLRARLVERVARMDGVAPGTRGYEADRVVLGTGSQQLLYLLTELLVDPGDIVILGHPSYFVFMDALKAAGASCRTAPYDDEGMRADRLEELFETLEASGELARVKMLYLVTYFENPTGISLSARRRRQVHAIVRRFSTGQVIHIVEDAAYRELRYAGRDVPSLRSLDDGKSVVYLGTFSKPFAPGFKTGYGIFPAELAAAVENLKGAHDFGSGNFAQHVLDRALESGLYDRHVRALRRHYRAKLAAMADTLDREMPPGVSRTHPKGGLYVWLTLPESVETGPESPLFKAALHRGVIYVPGEFCFAPDSGLAVPKNRIRLSFGLGDAARLREGCRRLADAVKERL